MTDRLRRSLKIRSMDSDYWSDLDLDETPTEGQRVQLNPLACLNLSYEPPVRGKSATRILNPLNWINRELYEIQVSVCGHAFTLKQLVDATRNFSPEMELRKGPVGVLYKAEFPNQSVAVEKICHGSKDIDEIRNEVYARKSLEHENIVKLFDGYSTKKLHLLIYEYMQNGSLEEALFEPSIRVELNWETRFNICLGVARGLRYLHDESSWFKVAHGSIKPSNIMLDATLTAKLTDFRFEWLRYDGDDPFAIIKSSSSYRGYMAPELALGKTVTPQADVYSYGIVLLEIVSGRCRFEYNPNQETIFLIDEMHVLHAKGMPLKLVDRRLGSSYKKNQALLIINLAKMCTDISPNHRPTMSEIVKVLEGEKANEELDSKV